METERKSELYMNGLLDAIKENSITVKVGFAKNKDSFDKQVIETLENVCSGLDAVCTRLRGDK